MIRFAAFTDLHYDHVFDGDRRIEEFLSAVENEKLDFIISLGDLCYPSEQNKQIITKLDSANVPVYYVVGNHDSDYCSQEIIKDFLELDSLHYSFVVENTKFIVMNSCFMKRDDTYYPYLKKNYDKQSDLYPVIPVDEIEWLKKEMANENLYYVICSHHSLANNHAKRGIANREEIREILSSRKTLLCLNGHDHGDACERINNIPYFTLNSMTYIWHGLKEMFVYDKDVHARYPYMKDMILYKNALHCIVEIDGDRVAIKGMESDYLHIIPEDVGILDRRWNGVSIQPKISDLKTKIM